MGYLGSIGYFQGPIRMNADFYQDGTPCLCDRMERTYYDSGELEYETPYVNGVIHGRQMLYEPYGVYNGTYMGLYEQWTYKFEIPFVNGIMQGKGVGYYHSGVVSIEKQFQDNECVYQKEYYPSGALQAEYPLKNKHKHGTARIYHETGELAEEIGYENGKLHGTRNIYHGEKVFEYTYLIDDHGPYDYPDAPFGMITRIRYTHGIRNGLETTHYADGSLFYEVEWKDGKRAGTGKTYDTDGSLLKETTYLYGDDIYGYTTIDTYAAGECVVDEALNHWFMPRGK